MTQYIKTINYCNHDTNQVFNCFCTGQKLTNDEAISLELVTKTDLNKYQLPNYTHNWFSIKPGDIIKVVSINKLRSIVYSFIIPKNSLTNLPTSIEPNETHFLDSYIHYLTKNCTFTMGI